MLARSGPFETAGLIATAFRDYLISPGFRDFEGGDRLMVLHCVVGPRSSAGVPSGKFMLDCKAFAASGGLMRAGEMPKHCG